MIFIKVLKNKIQIKKQKILIAFDDMIADMFSNEKLNPIVTNYLLEVENLILLLFLSQNLILLCQKYKTIFYTLFYYKNSK